MARTKRNGHGVGNNGSKNGVGFHPALIHKDAKDKALKGLELRERIFVIEYSKDFNSTRAAIRAGYSPRSAGLQGCRMLKRKKLKAAVSALVHDRLDRLQIEADDVLRELARTAFIDPRTLYNDEGGLLDISELPEDVATAIASIEVTEEFEGRGENREHVGRTKKIKFTDKLQALNMLGKHLKMFPTKVEVTGEDGVPLFPTKLYLPDNKRKDKALAAEPTNGDRSAIDDDGLGG